MKFAEHLSAHITPEWRKQYIEYEEMKSMLYNAVADADAEDLDEEERRKKFAQFDDYFFRYCDGELKKINIFFSEKLAESIRKFSSLKNELIIPKGPPGKKSDSRSTVPLYPFHDRPHIPARKLQDLKLAFTEFYLSLVLLQNYQSLNFTGFRKILKKHDKLLQTPEGSQWRAENVDNSTFHTNNDINRLISETEHLFTVYLEHGDRQKAMKRLRVPPLGEQRSPWITFKVGLFSGSFIVLSVTVILSAVFHENNNQFSDVYRLFRAPLLLMQFMFLIGVNVYGWRSSGVNHVLIFELDPRNHLSEQHLMELSAILGVSWALSVLSFLYSSYISIPPYVSPLVLLILILAFVLNPVKAFHYDARFWLVKLIGRIIAAPFFRVGFADFWLADQFNSLAAVFTDLHYTFCFYLTHNWLNGGTAIVDGVTITQEYMVSKTIVNCIPAWVRFAQCLRRYRDSRETLHLINAGKYASSMAGIISNSMLLSSKTSYSHYSENPYFYVYFICATIASTYTYTWDVKMDWGVFDFRESEYKFLREEIVYSSPMFYYLAIIEDFILRFFWLITFLLNANGWVSSEVISSVSAPLEIFRRFVWNFFRLENEHLNNCGKFRAVRDICIAPIAPSDPLEVIRMMDEEDGVINRSRRRPIPSYLRKSAKDDQKPLLTDEMNNMHVTLSSM
ncbi:hypothetical protein V9T40_014264 [Parthenolecanium corni]|uniref:Xenotropic and polytropic retrovirus receptor 1 n=1 Tax=Parthenolecanium corni TaxID=536013 RepID=A0AAN9T4Q7_9HEMI